MDKFNLVVRAARELAHAVQENYYDLSDLNIINYSEVCNWCNFPDLQAERYAANNVYGGMAVKSVELKQENSNGK